MSECSQEANITATAPGLNSFIKSPPYNMYECLCSSHANMLYTSIPFISLRKTPQQPLLTRDSDEAANDAWLQSVKMMGAGAGGGQKTVCAPFVSVRKMFGSARPFRACSTAPERCLEPQGRDHFTLPCQPRQTVFCSALGKVWPVQVNPNCHSVARVLILWDEDFRSRLRDTTESL